MLVQPFREPVPYAFDDLDAQVRPAVEHAADRDRQHEARDAAHRADLDGAFREPAHRIELLARVLGLVLQQRRMRQQRVAERGELHPFEWRSNKGAPPSSSRFRIRLSAGCVTCSASAARPRLPHATIVVKARNCRRSKVMSERYGLSQKYSIREWLALRYCGNRQAIEETPEHVRPYAPSAAPITVRDAVIDLLRQFGIDRVFGNPGSTELPMFRDFPDDFRYVLGLHEAVVVGMADGHAQATGNAAVVNLHSAAGVGNAMGNLFTAFKNRTPLIVTAGQQARAILPFDPFLGATQAAELPKPYVKWSIEPHARRTCRPRSRVRTASRCRNRAAPCSCRSRSTTGISRPSCCRAATSAVSCGPIRTRSRGSAMRSTPRGVPRSGRGSRRSRRCVGRRRAARRAAPCARVRRADVGRCSFPEDHPLFAGFLPAIREKIVARLDGHDLVFAFGAPAFTYHIEGFGPHVPPGATLVQLVDDPGLAAWTPSGDAVVGNLRLAARDLLARPRPSGRCRARRRARASNRRPPASACRSRSRCRRADVRDAHDIVVEEAPSARPVMQEHLPFTHSGTFYDGQRRPGYGCRPRSASRSRSRAGA